MEPNVGRLFRVGKAESGGNLFPRSDSSTEGTEMVAELSDEEIPRWLLAFDGGDEVYEVTEPDSVLFGEAETKMVVVVVTLGIGIPSSGICLASSISGCRGG